MRVHCWSLLIGRHLPVLTVRCATAVGMQASEAAASSFCRNELCQNINVVLIFIAFLDEVLTQSWANLPRCFKPGACKLFCRRMKWKMAYFFQDLCFCFGNQFQTNGVFKLKMFFSQKEGG